MSYIYKITNIITGKQYIGYTSRNNINRRFYQHKYEALNTPKNKNASYLYQAMRKYGTDNFIIQPILKFNQEQQNWQDLEKYYIKEFNTIKPEGYNLLQGGEQPPIHYGNFNNKTKIKDQNLNDLFLMLKDPSIPYKNIAEYFNVSVSELYKINQGLVRKQLNIQYPIRKFSQQELYALQVINILSQDVTLSNKKIADLIPNYFRANEIASINQGNKYAYLWNGDFPIRKVTVPDNYEEKQQIAVNVIQYIKQHKNQKLTQYKIHKETGYGRKIISKIIEGEYPYKLSNITYPIELNN